MSQYLCIDVSDMPKYEGAREQALEDAFWSTGDVTYRLTRLRSHGT